MLMWHRRVVQNHDFGNMIKLLLDDVTWTTGHNENELSDGIRDAEYTNIVILFYYII